MVSICNITTEETISVRHPVLREGKPLDSCCFEGDDLPTTFHLGAYKDNKLIGVVTYLQNSFGVFQKNNQGVEFQLRGMAVLTNNQGLGIGRMLVHYGEQILKEKKGWLVWCNAREIAVPFYKKLGFAIKGDAFEVPRIGTHYKMYKML